MDEIGFQTAPGEIVRDPVRKPVEIAFEEQPFRRRAIGDGTMPFSGRIRKIERPNAVSPTDPIE
jgi:hypothetical protein